VNPHDRYGIHWRVFLQGNWQFEEKLDAPGDYMLLVVRLLNTIGVTAQLKAG
jgi:hypothetical protein